MAIQFAQPQWLWLGALACAVLAALFTRAERKRRSAVALFAAASPETSVARPRRWLRNGLALLGVAMACVALARPLAGYRWEQTPHEGVDLMFAIDTSKSMRAADLRPDRLTRAKLAVADLVRKFDGERVGLIAFAGDAFVQAPMTVDRDVFLESLDALDTDVIPRGGTDIASAIRAADQAMASEPDHKKVLVLVTDGEDLAGDALAAARAAGQQGLTIYTVGVGSQQGALIEVATVAGLKELVRDETGKPVRSRLDEPMLRSLAQVTGGTYQPLGSDGRGLDTLYASVRAKLPRTTAAGTARKVYTERYQIPLALALGCLLFELVIGDRRRRSRVTRAAAAAVGLGLFVLPRLAAAAPARPDTVAAYNQGTATYRKGDFAAAQQQFEAALHTGDVHLQTDAYYDLGNARYRAGQAALAKDRDATIATWKQALAAYDTALGVTPGDADAKFNRDFVARKLAALEQQKQRDEDKKQQPKDQQGQGQQPKDQQGQGQQPKDQQGQGQQPKDQHGQAQQPKDQHGQAQQPKDQQGQAQQDQKQQGQGQQSKDQQGQGQQPKDQQGQGQQSKDQQGQGQQPKDQQGQGQQPKDLQQGQSQQPKDQQSQGQQPKGQQGQGQQPDDRKASEPPRRDAPDAAERADHAQPGKPGAAAATPAAAQQAAAQAAADTAHRAAGELTHGEAVQLLDSVEHELKPMPIHGRTGGQPEQTKTKDW